MAHRFNPQEGQRVLDTVNDQCFADLTPSKIVAILAENGIYIDCESTIYQITREEGLLSHLGRARPARPARPATVLEATGIHQVLAWDITLVPGPAKGQFFYL